MKKFFLASFAALISTVGYTQMKSLTLEDAVLKQYTDFYPKTLDQLQWVPNTHKLAYINEFEELVIHECNSSQTSRSIMLSDIDSWSGPDFGLKKFPKFSFYDSTSFTFRTGSSFAKVDIEANNVETLFEIPEGAEHVTMNEDLSFCAYIKDDNLFVMKSGGTSIQVTSDGKDGIIYGQAVHRYEFGIDRGMFWSPDGKRIAFYRMDESMVSQYPIVDISTTPASVNNTRYPMAGQKSHHVKLGVYEIGGKITYMNTEGDPEQYLTSIGWVPNSRALIIGQLNRDQNKLKVNMYDAQNGSLLQPLFEESHPKYVEPEHAPWFLPGSEDEFIWMSERSGYQHLYLYNTEGKLLRTLTNGQWEAQHILGFDHTKNYLFVSGTGEVVIGGKNPDETRNGLHRFTYMIDYELGGKTIIDSTLGTHSASLNDGGKFLLERFSSIETPAEINIYETNGKKLVAFCSAKDPLDSFNIAKPEIFTLKNARTTLYGRLIKPSHFDASKKYPVLIYVYGGPHAQLIRDTYLGGASLWMYHFAEQGYIVATLDNRGSANRGLDFEQSTFRKLGVEEMHDQKLLIDYLKSQSYVDGDNMAVHGWSYGGFMTTNMLLTFPGIFKAGVAGGPVCDWSMYEVMYTERYMDTPEANPDGFATANLVERAQYLEDDLLVIHGTADDVVVWQHSQAFLKSCIDQGIQLDYFVYPGHPHNVRGKDRVHLMTKVLNYVTERIGPGTMP